MTTTAPPKTFDRKTLRMKRDRAASKIHDHNFLHEKTAERLFDHMLPIKQSLHDIAVWGAHSDILCRRLTEQDRERQIYWLDLSRKLLQSQPPIKNCHAIVADEEYLPFAENSLDAIVSNLTLHHVNDLKGALIQSRMALKPGRPFLASIIGGESLSELRRTLISMEMEHAAGVSPRTAPFVDIRSLGDMFQQMGFVEPVMDSETVEICYSSLSAALADIRGMGEANVLQNREGTALSRKMHEKLDAHCQAEGLNIKVEIIYMLGWTAKNEI